ncbi:TetR family transcriptional regulator [Streptomyces sp. NBC_01340]|uniref:TetR/AcrR family transcriptional regulator n=1 Tax=unclassified Streptomyces TaxID=2593676 RepID=UPI0022574928|nr:MULTISPECIES: TetR family transcriptional regulator [unclassified Streptomyces]MCX4459799.1 TetR family transcriptional regulator [Streptomyces sp. NBC_01719]MCX4499157.1 TetR family transcriptional regulator [Streptomyces sp. NBC_01728]MCX4594927.1 TetR family transcriptional regulator [Streptomyces sp. NBC_01549]WSI43569.1 TetR family transcriptional regulator [Streptomyces sp. NBC_01340]
MPRDSSATKARLLDAAFTEFATYGIAGARVDRIAEAAGANKRLIYAYFGNKEQLFDEVLRRAMTAGAESVPFDVEDLPGYAGAIFDHLVARPDLMRLRLWRLLERPSTTGLEPDAFRSKAAEVAEAQRRGEVAQGMEPADLLTMVLAAAQAWFWAAEGLKPEDISQSWSPERLALHRSAVIEAARRMSEPKTADE